LLLFCISRSSTFMDKLLRKLKWWKKFNSFFFSRTYRRDTSSFSRWIFLYFVYMQMEVNKNDLLKFWPDLRTDNFIESKSLWRDQWRRFASCYNILPNDYIVYALNSRKRNDLKKILTSAGNSICSNSCLCLCFTHKKYTEQ